MKEPQSYGSQADWTTGKTGEKVSGTKSAPPEDHTETSEPWQGGRTSAVQLAEHAGGAARPARDIPASTGVSTREGGARRGSYFRKRDYE